MASYAFNYLVTKSVTVQVDADTDEAAHIAADARIESIASSEELLTESKSTFIELLDDNEEDKYK